MEWACLFVSKQVYLTLNTLIYNTFRQLTWFLCLLSESLPSHTNSLCKNDLSWNGSCNSPIHSHWQKWGGGIQNNQIGSRILCINSLLLQNSHLWHSYPAACHFGCLLLKPVWLSFCLHHLLNFSDGCMIIQCRPELVSTVSIGTVPWKTKLYPVKFSVLKRKIMRMASSAK